MPTAMRKEPASCQHWLCCYLLFFDIFLCMHMDPDHFYPNILYYSPPAVPLLPIAPSFFCILLLALQIFLVTIYWCLTMFWFQSPALSNYFMSLVYIKKKPLHWNVCWCNFHFLIVLICCYFNGTLYILNSIHLSYMGLEKYVFLLYSLSFSLLEWAFME